MRGNLSSPARKHIRRVAHKAYVVTEFLPEVSWAGAFNTIVAAAGHHIYEGRWLRDPVSDPRSLVDISLWLFLIRALLTLL